MNSARWVAVYMPIFVMLFIILPQQYQMQRLIGKKRNKRKEVTNLINEVINKYVGKNCKISLGTYSSNVLGKIIDVKENWIEIETKKGIEIINADFIQSIKIE